MLRLMAPARSNKIEKSICGERLKATTTMLASLHLGQPHDGIEHLFHRAQVDVVIGELAEYIDGHDAVAAQTVVAALVKLGGVEHRAARILVVQIDLQDIDGAVVGAIEHKVERIHFAHLQALVVGRQRNRARQMAMTLGLSSTAVTRAPGRRR